MLGMHASPARLVPLGQSSGFVEVANHREAASAEEPTGTEQSRGIRSRRKRPDLGPHGAVGSVNDLSKIASTCCGNELPDNEPKRPRAGDLTQENGESKPVEMSSGTCNKPTDQSVQVSDAPKLDYIHVRARRGQATDSHSLAERARREKISERMKILQDLVPGCNKVIGKASVLDEIINYIQSLQCQVEFLSMKLEAVNSGVNPGVEGFPAKDFGIRAFDASGSAFTIQQSREYGQGPSQEWLHMQVGGGYERET